MEIAIRTDAAVTMGTGHVMRCLTLAQALREAGARCRFVSRAHRGHLARRIADAGFDLSLLPAAARDPVEGDWLGLPWQQDARDTRSALADGAPPDWLIVDHYGIDAAWERAVAGPGTRVGVIDDRTDRPHACVLLLNQNHGARAEDYAGLVPAGAQVLAGTAFALLRPEFADLRGASLARRDTPLRPGGVLLVSMGGSDPDNATGAVLAALAEVGLPEGWRLCVVMGGQAPHLDSVRAQLAALPMPHDLVVDTPHMAQLMADADLAIGAAGTTSWERCTLGLPCLVAVLAENQVALAEALIAAGAARPLRLSSAAGRARFAADLAELCGTGNARSEMSRRAAAVADGTGVARVVQMLKKLSFEEPADTDD
jgi:UDP-2,4-diacetamido-2,4,6-trideoxy-beta-L-altropyranose hydrolase